MSTNPERPDRGVPEFKPIRDIRDVMVGEEVRARLANGCAIFSGWIDEDDPEARVSGDYLRLEAPDGTEILYYESSEWLDQPANTEVIGAFVNACAGFLPESVPRKFGRQLHAVSPRGIPILPLPAKLRALEYCIENGFIEDALGHLFDLLNFVAPEYRYRDLSSLVLLQAQFGAHPTSVTWPSEPPE